MLKYVLNRLSDYRLSMLRELKSTYNLKPCFRDVQIYTAINSQNLCRTVTVRRGKQRVKSVKKSAELSINRKCLTTEHPATTDYIEVHSSPNVCYIHRIHTLQVGLDMLDDVI